MRVTLKMLVMFPREPRPANAWSPPTCWSAWSLLRMDVIIVARPTTMPARSGARKVMLDLMSETTSARRSLRRWLILSMFLRYSEIDMSDCAAICSPFFADSMRMRIDVAMSAEGNEMIAPTFLSNTAFSIDMPSCWMF